MKVTNIYNIYPSWESTTSLPRSRMTFDRVKVWKHGTKVYISQTWLFANQLSKLKMLPLQVDEPLKNLPFSLHVFSSEYWSSLVEPDPRTLKFQRNIRAKHLLIRHANPSGPTSETHLTLDDCERTWRSSNVPGIKLMNGICVSEPEMRILWNSLQCLMID